MVTLPPHHPPHMEVNASHSLGGGCDQSSGAVFRRIGGPPNMNRLLQCVWIFNEYIYIYTHLIWTIIQLLYIIFFIYIYIRYTIYYDILRYGSWSLEQKKNNGSASSSILVFCHTSSGVPAMRCRIFRLSSSREALALPWSWAWRESQIFSRL